MRENVDYYLGLGSNFGDKEKNILKALEWLSKHPKLKIVSKSGCYETEPVGKKDQENFLNMCVGIEADLCPRDLLNFCLKIEEKMGRERKEKWGPRIIDIDILLYDDCVFDEPDFKVPHPRLHERKFVLVPLAEIAPEAIHPLLNKNIETLLIECKDESEIEFVKEFL